MKTFTWKTDYAHNDNEQTMEEYLHEYCELEITKIDGAYAVGKDENGDVWAIHASGNGDFFNHKIEFEAL